MVEVKPSWEQTEWNIKDCPFCGATAYLKERDGYPHTTSDYFVGCPKCNASGGYGKTKDQAIINWNQRV